MSEGEYDDKISPESKSSVHQTPQGLTEKQIEYLANCFVKSDAVTKEMKDEVVKYIAAWVDRYIRSTKKRLTDKKNVLWQFKTRIENQENAIQCNRCGLHRPFSNHIYNCSKHDNQRSACFTPVDNQDNPNKRYCLICCMVFNSSPEKAEAHVKSHTANELFELGFCCPPKMLIEVDDCVLDPEDTLPTDDLDFVKKFTRFINNHYSNVHVAPSIKNIASMAAISKADNKLREKFTENQELDLVLKPL